jgi:DNA polymerase-3 subunit alpha
MVTLDDPDTFKLLQAANTTAVFQLESRGMKDLITRLKPDTFEDIVALVALFRPGPLQSGMVDDFINRKHGRMKVEYPHPDLEPILKPTYGVILYQEQVMQIAQVLAGYTLGGADMLRRAMGKKKAEEMAKQRAIFVQGATERGVDAKLAEYIFDLMEKFAGYGFNRSHSAAYALLSYQTAWLKCHYPAEFMAAVLSADMDNTDKVVSLIEDSHKQGLAVCPPDINQSVYPFSVQDEKTVIYGLGAIKGVGGAALDGIITEREASGPYTDLYDFCKRNDTRKVNKRVMEALVKAGALDALGRNRASLMASLPGAVQMAEKAQADAIAGQHDMFGDAPAANTHESVHVIEVDDWDDELRLYNEKETLGLYLTGHPIDRYEKELAKFTDCRLEKITEVAPPESTGDGGYRRNKGKDYRLAGLMVGMRTRKTSRGGKMITAVLDDRTARIEVTMFNEVNEQFGHLLQKDKLLIVEGTVSWDDFNGTWSMRAKTIYDITEAREVFSRCLEIDVDRSRMNGEWSDAGMTRELTSVLQTYREGRCPVCISYNNGNEVSRIRLGEEWRVQPTDELLGRLERLVGEGFVGVVY